MQKTSIVLCIIVVLQGTDVPGMQKTLYTLSTATYKCGVRSGNESIRTGGVLINRELNITVVFRL